MKLNARFTGLLGLSMMVLGDLWGVIHEYLAKRNDPPGWVVDRYPYQPAVLVAWLGLLILAGTLLVLSAKFIYKRISK